MARVAWVTISSAWASSDPVAAFRTQPHVLVEQADGHARAPW